MENVCDLLVLGDEYQVAKVKKECRKFLMSATLDDQMAMKVILLAKRCGLTDLRTKCCTQLSFIEPHRLEQLAGFQDLDGDSMKKVLLPHLERTKISGATLQTSLKEVLPQLVGLLEFLVYLIGKTNECPFLKICPIHYDASGKASSPLRDRLKSCTACQATLNAITELGRRTYYYDKSGSYVEGSAYFHSQDSHFDEKILELLSKLMILQEKV